MTIKHFLYFSLFGVLTSGCYRCYTCTGQTAFGETERDVCGRPSEIEPLISNLESDTTNPWVCKRQ